VRLYHYACSHSAAGIRADGFLRPHAQVLLGDVKLVWLTDMEVPDADALGLTSWTLRCDRTEHRFEVDYDAQRWVSYARGLTPEQRWALEIAPGARPMHWWVSTESVPILRGVS